MRGPRALKQSASDGDAQHYRGPAAGGGNLDPSAGIPGALAHASQAVSFLLWGDVKSRAVILNRQLEPSRVPLESRS